MMCLFILLVVFSGNAAPATSDSALFARASELYEAKNDSAAAELFFRLAVEFPNSERAPEALYYSGVLFYKLKRIS
jgi:TolA-binding protein